MMIIMTEDRIAELRALCAEYEQKKAACESAGLKTKAADIAADGVGRRAMIFRQTPIGRGEALLSGFRARTKRP